MHLAASWLVLAASAGRAPAQPKYTPWVAGEYLEYSLKFGVIPAGSGRMQVLGRDTVRGRELGGIGGLLREQRDVLADLTR